jgi:hypothetical protein
MVEPRSGGYRLRIEETRHSTGFWRRRLCAGGWRKALILRIYRSHSEAGQGNGAGRAPSPLAWKTHLATEDTEITEEYSMEALKTNPDLLKTGRRHSSLWAR